VEQPSPSTSRNDSANPKPNPRPAKEVIDDALKDNASWEWLLYIFIAAAGTVGIAAVVVGIITGEPVASGAGGVITAALAFPIRAARQLRADNIRIRLFELALAKAKTQEEAVEVLEKALGKKGGDAT
jgi:hypothetical protein